MKGEPGERGDPGEDGDPGPPVSCGQVSHIDMFLMWTMHEATFVTGDKGNNIVCACYCMLYFTSHLKIGHSSICKQLVECSTRMHSTHRRYRCLGVSNKSCFVYGLRKHVAMVTGCDNCFVPCVRVLLGQEERQEKLAQLVHR